MPQHLTSQEAAKAALAAYEAGSLLAQNAGNEFIAADYRREINGETCFCAIGAGLKPDVIDAIREAQVVDDDYLSISGIIEEGFITTNSPGDLQDLQSAHDCWLLMEYSDKPLSMPAESRFLDLCQRLAQS